MVCGCRLFAKTFDVGLSLIRRLIDVLADFGDVLVFPYRLYVNDNALPVGGADNPPIRKSRVRNGAHKNG